MRRLDGRAWAVLIAGLVIVVIASLVATRTLIPRVQHGLAKAVDSSEAALSPTTSTPAAGPSVTALATPPATTPTPVSTPVTPAPATPTSTATATPTPTPAPPPEPDPVTALLEHDTVTASNGISIGCQPGDLAQYLTCKAKEPAGYAMTFYLFIPRGYRETTKYPLVVQLEGSGQRANPDGTAEQNAIGAIGNPSAMVFGPGYPQPYSVEVQNRWPSFVVIPQMLDTERFVSVTSQQGSYTMPAAPEPALRLTKEIVDTLQLVYPNIDADRLYLTGYSMGGYGAWEAAERWPNYWAAVAPIAGGGDPSLAARLVNVPIWAFQSANDDVVPISASRDMIAAIRAAGGNPLYTEYLTLGHGSWVAPYTIMGRPSPTPNFFNWLFAQHK